MESLEASHAGKVYIDFTFGFKRMSVTKPASQDAEYMVEWKRGHHGSGTTGWKGLSLEKDKRTGGHVVEWNSQHTLNALHLPRKGAEGVKARCMELTAFERVPGGQPQKLKTVQWNLEFSAKDEGKKKFGYLELDLDGAKTIIIHTSYTMRQTSPENVAMLKQSRRAKGMDGVSGVTSNGSCSPARGADFNFNTTYESAPETREAISPTDNTINLNSPSWVKGDDINVEKMKNNVLQLYARLHAQEMQLQERRNEVRELRKSYAALKDDYESVREELDVQDMECARLTDKLNRERERERLLSKDIYSLRDDLQKMKDEDRVNCACVVL